MSFDEAGKNLIDLFKLLLKILVLLIGLQIIFDLMGVNIELPLIKTIMNGVAGWLKGSFGFYEIKM